METSSSFAADFFPARYARLSAPLEIAKSVTHKTYNVAGRELQIASPITFTPFASATPCTARCQFCSEALIHKHATVLSASLRPTSAYGTMLREALRALRRVPMGLSLSGLEATSSSAWLLDVLEASEEHARAGEEFIDKVLYSNGTGLGEEILLEGLRKIELTRVEMSRHSIDDAKNDSIMRFREGIAVRNTEKFEANVRKTLLYVPVKLVCVVQQNGVAAFEDVLPYLAWADRLGVDTVVFRELSRLHDLYKPNMTAKYVEQARIAIEPLVDLALESAEFELEQVTSGYYYWNLMFRWKGPSGRSVRAIFETSDYQLMKNQHQSNVVYKLVFHANGNLCADWDPNTHVLLKTKRDLR